MTPPPSVIGQQEPEPQPRQRPAPPPAFSPQPQAAGGAAGASFAGVHASPSVRRLARELGIDLTKVRGTGEKGRVTQEDVRSFLKGPAAPAAAAAAPSGGMGIPEIPAVDFSKFGPVETRPLARIKRISGPFLHRAWLNVPHVTHGDEADITEIEEYRKQLDSDAKADKKKPYRVSLLPFLMKASVSALKMFPEFNSSLTPEKDALVYKKYYNIGIAVDTPEGLVVPVFKDVDRKGIVELSRELGDTSAKARDGKLAPADMQGGDLHHLLARRHRRHRLHADRQRARGGDPGRGPLEDGAGLGRRGVQAAADAPALRLLRPPRDRRGPGRPLHAPPVHGAGRRAPAGAVSGGEDR